METNKILEQKVVSNLKSNDTKISLFTLFLFLFSMTIHSQNSSLTSKKTTIQTSGRLISLQKLVEKIKSENESLQNIKAVNVMVDDLLIENPQEFMINPKNIEAEEVLVLNSNDAFSDKMIGSIIINTRDR